MKLFSFISPKQVTYCGKPLNLNLLTRLPKVGGVAPPYTTPPLAMTLPNPLHSVLQCSYIGAHWADFPNGLNASQSATDVHIILQSDTMSDMHNTQLH